MKTTTTITTALLTLIASATPLLAASGAREDNTGIVVWVFLGFCALIVLAQMVPAILMALGFIRSTVPPKEAEKEAAPEA